MPRPRPEYRLVDLPLTSGLSQKQDARQLGPGNATVVTNLIKNKAGTLQKPLGFSQVSNTTALGGLTLGNAKALATRGPELLAVASDTVYGDGVFAVSESALEQTVTDPVVLVDRAPGVRALPSRSVASFAQNPQSFDTLVYRDFELHIWTTSAGALYYAVTDSVTGRALVGPQVVPGINGAIQNAKLILCGSVAVLLAAVRPELVASSFNMAAPLTATWSAASDVTGSTLGAALIFDAAADETSTGKFNVIYESSSPSIALVNVLVSTLAVQHSATFSDAVWNAEGNPNITAMCIRASTAIGTCYIGYAYPVTSTVYNVTGGAMFYSGGVFGSVLGQVDLSNGQSILTTGGAPRVMAVALAGTVGGNADTQQYVWSPGTSVISASGYTRTAYPQLGCCPDFNAATQAPVAAIFQCAAAVVSGSFAVLANQPRWTNGVVLASQMITKAQPGGSTIAYLLAFCPSYNLDPSPAGSGVQSVVLNQNGNFATYSPIDARYVGNSAIGQGAWDPTSGGCPANGTDNWWLLPSSNGAPGTSPASAFEIPLIWQGAGSGSPSGAVIYQQAAPYTAEPTVTVTGGGGTGAVLRAKVGACMFRSTVRWMPVLTVGAFGGSGTGYQSGDEKTMQVTVDPPPAGGEQCMVQVSSVNSNGSVNFEMIDSGSGYLPGSYPAALVTGGHGQNAFCYLQVGLGVVTPLEVVSPGSGYTNPATIKVNFEGGNFETLVSNTTAYGAIIAPWYNDTGLLDPFSSGKPLPGQFAGGTASYGFTGSFVPTTAIPTQYFNSYLGVTTQPFPGASISNAAVTTHIDYAPTAADVRVTANLGEGSLFWNQTSMGAYLPTDPIPQWDRNPVNPQDPPPDTKNSITLSNPVAMNVGSYPNFQMMLTLPVINPATVASAGILLGSGSGPVFQNIQGTYYLFAMDTFQDVSSAQSNFGVAPFNNVPLRWVGTCKPRLAKNNILSQTQVLPHLVPNSEGGFQTLLPVNENAGEVSLEILPWDFSPTYQPATLGNATALACGVPTLVSASGIEEFAFPYYPENISPTLDAATGLIPVLATLQPDVVGLEPDGSYQYIVTYERQLLSGKTVSARSVPITVVTGPAGTTALSASVAIETNQYQVTLRIPTMGFSMSQHGTNLTNLSGVPPQAPITIRVYRTTNGGTTFYDITSQIPNSAQTLGAANTNSLHLAFTSIVDQLSDTLLVNNALLYGDGSNGTDPGSILDNLTPPSFDGMIVHKNRFWGWTGTQVWYSKAFTSGEVPGFHEEQAFSWDDGPGPITALASQGDRLVLFKSDRIAFVTGDGPTDNGSNNDLQPPLRIDSDVGCIEPRSVVTTPKGVWFQSSNGLYLLAGTVGAAGKPVEDVLTAYPVIVSAALNAPAGTVSWIAQNQTPNDSVLIQYNYILEAWTVQHPLYLASGEGGGTGPLVMSGQAFATDPGSTYNEDNLSLTLSDIQGNIWRQNSPEQIEELSPAPWYEFATPYPVPVSGVFQASSWQSPWIKATSLQGFGKWWMVNLLWQVMDSHNLTVTLAYDYNPTAVDTYLVSALQMVNSSNYPTIQWRFQPSRGSAQAMQITATDSANTGAGPTTTTGQGFLLLGVAVEYGLKVGAMRVPAVQRN